MPLSINDSETVFSSGYPRRSLEKMAHEKPRTTFQRVDTKKKNKKKKTGSAREEFGQQTALIEKIKIK